MGRLEIRVLGAFEATLDGDPITGFESDSERALLTYLALEPGRSRSRAVLAEMLWPDRPTGGALSNLRHVLSVIRKAAGAGGDASWLLRADRNTVSVVDSPDVRIDLLDFERLAATPPGQEGAAEQWQKALDLWRGPFLESLALSAGVEWEEWVIVTAERARRRLVGVLRHLADHHERAGDWGRAIPLARRLVDVDPWDERSHRQLMRLLAHSGDRVGALRVYQSLCERLEKEFATEPAAPTAALVDRIRDGDIESTSADIEVVYPAFLTGSSPPVTPPLFVGREAQLDWLAAHLKGARAGAGHVALVAGEAGSGKSMLTGEFMKREVESGDVLVARGRCNAYGGIGDPYLPFREILALLSGDVAPDLTAGAINHEQATRLWEALPVTARMIADRGQSMLGVMVNGGALLGRAREALPGAEWLGRLTSHVERAASRPAGERMQPALFDEFTSVLAGIAGVHPLLLVIDDLQWADPGSIALFWHLARRLGGLRILLVGLYRPEEIAGDQGTGHALESILTDLQAIDPRCATELGADRSFIDALLDAEPNELGRQFRDRLFSYTQGHPLYTVEMVRGMQDRAEIRRDRRGIWTVQSTLDWDRLPARVEAVISQRIARLPADLKADLSVAAVQGEEFVGETVAAVRGDLAASARLSRESMSPERLVEPAEVTRVQTRIAARHRFRHILFQRYLYERLSPAERIRLHEATGRALEDLYQDHPDPPVVELARHFDAAGLVEPAVAYLQRAGTRAIQMSANEEAIQLLERADVLIQSLPASADRDQAELALLVSLAAPTMAVRGYASASGEVIGRRVRELCDRVPPSPIVVMALIGLAQVLSIRAQHRAAASASDEALGIARELDEESLQVLAEFELGYCLMWSGDLEASNVHLRNTLQRHDVDRDGWLRYVFGIEPGVEAQVWAGGNCVIRGFTAEAARLADAGIAMARELAHPFTLCHVLAVEAVNRLLRNEYRQAIPLIDELAEMSTAEHFPYWSAGVDVYRGWAEGNLGDPEMGAAMMQRGLNAWRAMGAECHRGFFSAPMGELKARSCDPSRGCAIVDQALSDAQETDEHLSVLHLQVERGRLIRLLGDDAAAPTIERAMKAAAAAGAWVLELRAAVELADVLSSEGRIDEARDVLTKRCDSFAGDSDHPDLLTARTVLERL